MDSDNPPPRKPRFAPKPQNRRKTRSSAVPKTENVDEEVSENRRRLLQRFDVISKSSLSGSGRFGSVWVIIIRDLIPSLGWDVNSLPLQITSQTKRFFVDFDVLGVAFGGVGGEVSGALEPGLRAGGVGTLGRAPVQVAFTYEANQVTTTRISDAPRAGSLKQSSGLDLMELDDDTGHSSESSCSVAGPSEAYSRKDILDVAEFGEGVREVEYDETTINAASKLGFLSPDESGENNRLLFFQLPQSLPAMKRVASAKGKEKAVSYPTPNQKGSIALAQDGSSITGGTSQRPSSLKDLSAGLMGKLLVYKSGAVKMKLGDILYTVSPGADCTMAQDVAQIDTKRKTLCEIRNLDGQAVVTPDVDYLLDSIGLD
ncbi:hypothetical protein KSS87_020023 [Heliosperma pusillum]|nr:hypothetical protein KSS87_020023 [Heliosperma pusillum]